MAAIRKDMQVVQTQLGPGISLGAARAVAGVEEARGANEIIKIGISDLVLHDTRFSSYNRCQRKKHDKYVNHYANDNGVIFRVNLSILIHFSDYWE